MTIVLAPITVRRQPRPLRSEEVAELAATTRDLPHLVRPVPADMADGALRVEAAVWDVARRFDVSVCPTCSVLDVADALAGRGWSTGPARDALRALVMLRGAGDVVT